jgi:hypothetical protein
LCGSRLNATAARPRNALLDEAAAKLCIDAALLGTLIGREPREELERSLVHVPKKCEAVFGKEHAPPGKH